MTTQSNAMLDVFHKAHAKASDYMGKASVWLILSALALRDALRGEEIMGKDGKPLPQPHLFTADDAKALVSHLVHKAGCDSAAEAKAAAPFKGNRDKVQTIAREYRNRRNAAARDVIPAIAAAYLAKHWNRDAVMDYNKGKVAVPAAWFLPHNIADEAAQAMLPRNPLSLMLEPTSTSDRASVAYFTAEGFDAFQRDMKRWEAAGKPKEGKPEPADFAAYAEIGVNATGMDAAHKALLSAINAEAKAKEAREKAEAARKAAEAAATIAKAAEASGVDPATAQAAKEAAAMAQAAQEVAASEAIEAETKAAEATAPKPQAQRAPQNSGDKGPLVMTIATATDFLMSCAMADDGRRNFAPAIMEQWQNLAAAIWRNPNLAHAFLIEREALAKEQAANVREAQKAKA